jgi:Myb/SANT-like DNA-binding domain
MARGQRAPASKWSDQDIEKLIAGLLEARDNGLSSENGFKSTVWASIAASFDDPLKASFDDPLKKASRICESKWSRLKIDYKAVKFLRDSSGFGWDEARSLVTAEPEVWTEMAMARIIPFLPFHPSSIVTNYASILDTS